MRPTKAIISLTNIGYNIKEIINHYPNYEYYMGVVKADSYGHYDLRVIEVLINSGINYLCVSSIDEGLHIRNSYKEVPILCLEPVMKEDLLLCLENNITITISSLNNLKELLDSKLKLKVHIKLDTGMNRLGFKDKEELNEAIKLLLESNIEIEGIYSHIHSSTNKLETEKQFNKFEDFINYINYKQIKIIHLFNSSTLMNYPKNKYCNGTRLGLIMYGFSEDDNLLLKSTYSLYSKIIEIKKLKQNEIVSYEGNYEANDDEIIGIVPIGYADGITRSNTGRTVLIKDKEYPIVGNICMDMLMVKIDETINLYDDVTIIKDVEDIKRIAGYNNTIPYEIICLITNRVNKIYE